LRHGRDVVGAVIGAGIIDRMVADRFAPTPPLDLARQLLDLGARAVGRVGRVRRPGS